MLDVRKLIMLRDIATHGTMRSAAKALGISTSALSQHMAKFEREIGTALTMPQGRGVQLTPVAQQLVKHAETILSTLEEAEATVTSHRQDLAGTVRIAAFHTFALTVLERVLSLLHERAPAVRLDFVQLDPEDALVEVLARRVDIAIIDEYPGFPLPPAQGLVATLLAREVIGVFVPARLSLTATPTVTQLSQLQWVVEPQHSDAFHWFRSVCRRAGFEPRVRYESPDLAVHRTLTQAGFAASMLPSTVSESPSAIEAQLVQLPGVPEADLHRTLHTVIRRGAERARLIVLLQQVIAEATNSHVVHTPPAPPTPPARQAE